MQSVRVIDSSTASKDMADVEEPVPKKGLTEDQKKMMAEFTKGVAPALILGMIFATGFIILVLIEWLDFSIFVKTSPQDLPDIQSRTGFALRYSIVGGLWVTGCLCVVAVGRSLSPAMDPTSGNDQYVQNLKNILNNSFEQFVLSLISQLILVQYLDAEHTIKFIPALTFLFIFGRITFAIGYPKYRHFGFMLNLFPLVLTMGYNGFKLFFD